MAKLYICLLSGCLAAVVLAEHVDTTPYKSTRKLLVPRFNSTGPNLEDFECLSERAPDYYGIGVRLGVYFSWWTSWVANIGMPEEVGGALDQNAVFLFANIIALVRCTITFVLTQLDCLILMHLGMGTVLSVLSTWGYRTCQYTMEGPEATKHYGGIGTHLRLGLSVAISTFAVWFWMIGILPGNDDLVNDSGPCGTVYTFMFGKIKADGPIRTFYIIVSVFWTIYFGIMLCVSPLAVWVRLHRIITLTRLQRFRTSHRLHVATGLNYKQLRYSYHFLRGFNAFWIIWSMLTVEFTLNYNHVKSVLGPQGRIYFPSQLIPMIIGAFTLTRLLYKKFEKVCSDDIEPTVTREDTIRGEPQRRPTGKDMLKLFAPPSSEARATRKTPPEDTDVDPAMENSGPFYRYIVAYLPWLSLLPTLQKDTELRHQIHKGQEPNPDLEARGNSDQGTLREFPDAGENKEKFDFSNRIEDVDNASGRGTGLHSITGLIQKRPDTIS